MSKHNFVVSGPKFIEYLLFNTEGTVVDNAVDACRYLNLFQKYLQSKSKVVLNCAKFWTFLPSQILRGWCSPNFVHVLTPPYSGTSRGKVAFG